MNKPNNKRKKDSQERIEKVFLQLIQKKEVTDITVTQICNLAKVNRTTFYANYLDIYDLTDKVRERMILEFADIFKGNHEHSKENYLKLFEHIKENQIFYKTYFKLGYDVNYDITYFDKELASKMFDNKFIPYHCEFFKAGITAIIKMWLKNYCKESPDDILEIIESEYNNRK